MTLQLRAGLAELVPFTPGLNAEQVAARFGVDAGSVVKLGSGENPHGPSPRAVEAIAAAASELHEYPEWTAARLRAAVADHVGVDLDRVVCGAGETELISAVVRAFADPGDEVLMHETTFPVYHLYAEAEGRTPVYADAGWAETMDVGDLLCRATDRTRVVFLTSPHNPSGRLVDVDDIAQVCAAVPDALVVADEAYIHFSQQPRSALALLDEHPNLLVMRTFSKAYGLAGLRVGFAVGNPEGVGALMRVKPTWNLGPLQVAGAIAALADENHLEKTTEHVKSMRRELVGRIDAFDDLAVVPGSEANFVLVRIDREGLTSTDLHARLASHGLVVKDCAVSYRGLGDRYVRIDVGAEDVMARLFSALAEELS